jgi:hypothetical protein
MPAMNLGHDLVRTALSRRTFLVASGAAFGGLRSPALVKAGRPGAAPSPGGKARSTILIWLTGGPSHIDTWDMKPDAPPEYRGEFKPIATSAPGVRLCEHLPQLARQAHHLAVVNSLGHFNRAPNEHEYYYNLTGQAPEPGFNLNRKPRASDAPFMGSAVAYSRPAHSYLPSVVSLAHQTGYPAHNQTGQGAGRLGPEYDPVHVLTSRQRPLEFLVPNLTLQGAMDVRRLASRRQLLRSLDGQAAALEHSFAALRYDRHQAKALSLLASARTKSAFDLSWEPAAVRARYGETSHGMLFLMARRLVEAAVPFVTIYWFGGLDGPPNSCGQLVWDTHADNFGILKNCLLPDFDRCFSALLEDLHQRGLLGQTLVLVTGEMGRTPKVGDPRSGGSRGSGRDHWTHCMSALFAGGGVRGGRTYGASDKIAAYPVDQPVGPEDITRTVYHAMGIDRLEATDREGRPFDLLPDGAPLRDLF